MHTESPIAVNRPKTLNLVTTTTTTASTNSSQKNLKLSRTRKEILEQLFAIVPWWDHGDANLTQKSSGVTLRRAHSLIMTRHPALPPAATHVLRTRSRSTATTPSSAVPPTAAFSASTTLDVNVFNFERKTSAEVVGPRLLESLQENRILSHATTTTSNGHHVDTTDNNGHVYNDNNSVVSDNSTIEAESPTSFSSSSSSSLLSPSYQQPDQQQESPLKVFSRINCIRSLTPDGRLDHGSCHAVRTAVSTLYNIEDFDMVKIGEGFFSEVFKVVHRSLGKVMVLKRNKHRAHRMTMLKETQLLNTLHHPNILRFEGACVHEGQLHALVEYVEGGSLDQLIQQVGRDGAENEFPWKLRVSLARDVSQGLEYLHSRGFFHRDLTSKNILIRHSRSNTERSMAVVADFGLAAKIPRSHDERLPQVGSPYWMSPECLHGKFYNETADVFSFGIILCEMIACVEADPDFLPRTENFGVDYLAFSELVPAGCPSEYLKLAFTCVSIDPKRPPFKSLTVQLGDIEDQIRQEEETAAELARKQELEQQQLQVQMLQEQKIQEQMKPPQKVSLYTETPVKNAISLSRRCFSQRKATRCSPSEVARLHNKKFPRPLRSETPVAIGEKMSKLDPFYIPSPATGINPFAQLPRRLSDLGGGKYFGPRDLFYSCFELTEKFASPSAATTSGTQNASEDSQNGDESENPVYRKAVSMINREPLTTEDLLAELESSTNGKNLK